MERIKLEDLPRDTLIKLLQVSSKNWATTDGLWFQGVEDKYGMEVAVELDRKMWERLSLVGAKRIREALGLKEEGISAAVRMIDIMSLLVGADSTELVEETPNKVVFQWSRCPFQEARVRGGRGEFPCKTVGATLFDNAAKVGDPKAKVECLICPPDPHPENLWCKWELNVGGV